MNVMTDQPNDKIRAFRDRDRLAQNATVNGRFAALLAAAANLSAVVVMMCMWSDALPFALAAAGVILVAVSLGASYLHDNVAAYGDGAPTRFETIAANICVYSVAASYFAWGLCLIFWRI